MDWLSIKIFLLKNQKFSCANFFNTAKTPMHLKEYAMEFTSAFFKF